LLARQYLRRGNHELDLDLSNGHSPSQIGPERNARRWLD
jgi:hypothetical protein